MPKNESERPKNLDYPSDLFLLFLIPDYRKQVAVNTN